MHVTASRARLNACLALSALALTLACGGGSASSSASSASGGSSSAPPPSQPLASLADPFWASDSPSRPHRAEPLHPVAGATGAVMQLTSREIALVKASTASLPAASAPSIAGASAAAASPAFAAPLRIVTGLRSFTYHQDNATTLQPLNLTGAIIQALVPNASGGFDTLAGVGHDDGTFSIQNVPTGYYWLKFGRSYLWTSVDHVDWVFDAYGRADAEYPGTQPTTLAMTATGLNPWQSTDELLWTVPNEGYTLTTKGAPLGISNPPAPGDAALNAYSFEFVDLGLPLLDATKGDQAYLSQLTTRSAAGQTYRALGKVFYLPAVTMADGVSTPANGGLMDIPQASTLHLGWKRSALAAMTSSVNPNATVVTTEFGLWVSPLGTGMGIPGDAFQLFTYDSGDVGATTDLDLGDLAYGNPFPATWTPLAETYFTWSVSYLAPGASSPTTVTRSAYTATTTMPTAAAPIAPLQSPAQNPRINGKSLFQNQVSVGLTPALAWDAPATGTPAGYVVTVYQLANNAGASELTVVGTLRTAARQMTLPPGLLAAGNTYVMTISAVRSAGISYASNPYQTSFPYATAPVATAIIAP